MGDVADAMIDEGIRQQAEHDNAIGWYLGEYSDADLVHLCNDSRKLIMNGIRRYFKIHKKLSDKQRLVLARHCAKDEWGQLA